MSAEYIAGIVEILSRHSRYTQNRLADIGEGIMSVCEFPPTIAHIEKLVKKWDEIKPAHTTYKKFDPTPFPEGYDHDVESRKAFIASLDLKNKFPKDRPLPPTDYNPFPKLTEAFAKEPHLLRNATMTFDVLFDASRALAIHGIEEARVILNANKPKKPVDGLAPIGAVTEAAFGGSRFATGRAFPERLMRGDFDHDT